ncbi:DUF1802 family protein [Planctomicrobium piriforme]|uniref:DUF1802 family protein n=1 Tax=Planctomicrobium piriforme TaxID=1576369 RepID=A0A1I3TIK9_9PLAN|nr:DUF1802 family protein [Planctomicrobium piriforme]SFJ70343.1 hypothetical protein SAMN05421753_13031 [Planctomicrobium piriforme]
MTEERTICAIALKEWAVVCQALATGEQLVLFRKGGIHEGADGFQPEHAGFWLFPTGFHQSLENVRDQHKASAAACLGEPPAAGVIPIQTYCRIESLCWVSDEQRLAALRPFHILTDEAVAARFHYRQPGVFVLQLEVCSLPTAVTVPANPRYDGCHSWVELDDAISTAELQPLIQSREQAQRVAALKTVLPELKPLSR